MIKSNKRSTSQLLIVMVFASLVVTGISLFILHRVVINEKKQSLKELCETQASLIRSIYYETHDVYKVISIINAHTKFHKDLGKTREFVIATLKNDTLYFLNSSRNGGFSQSKTIAELTDKGIPIKMALMHKQGFIKGPDYRGNFVYAYVSYVPGLQWGIVAKVDRQEVLQPFYEAGIYVVLSSLILVLIGAIIFKRISGIIIKRIAKSEERYKNLFEFSALPTWEEDFSLVKGRFVQLANQGINDFREYFETHKEEISHLASLVKVIDVNLKSVHFFNVNRKEEIITNLLSYFTDVSLDVFKEEMIALAEGQNHFDSEIPIRMPDGSIRYILLNLSVMPGYENSLAKVLITFIDFTDRKLMEEELLQSREEWVSTFDLIPDLIAIIDDKHRIIRANKAMAEKLGIGKDEVEGRHCFGCVHDLNAPPQFCPHARMLKDKKEHMSDVHEARLGGDFLVSVTPVFDRNGNFKGGVHVARDITEHKKREAQLKKLNQTLIALSKSNQAMVHAREEAKYLNEVCEIIVHDCGHAMVWIGFAENDENKSVKPIASAGFDKGYIDGLRITWADTERGQGPTGTAIRTGKPYLCNNMFTDPKFALWRNEASKRGYASSLVIPIMIDGKAVGAINIYSREPDSFLDDEVNLLTELASDLSQGISAIRLKQHRDLAEEALRASEEKYRMLFTSMIDGFAYHEIVLDENRKPCDYRFLSINPAFEELTGLKAEDVVGKRVLEVMPATEHFWIEIYGNVAMTGKGFEFENYSAELKKYFKVNAFSPKEGYFAVVFEDITRRRIAEDQLKKYAADLQELNATKDKFFGIIAHDLRNPFSSLLGASELLASSVDQYNKDSIRKFSSLLYESAKKGYELLENLLEWSRSQTGTLNFSPSEIDMSKLIAENLSTMKLNMVSKKIKLYSDVPDGLKAVVDINMFNTILRNLLNNAIKFTHEKGNIWVIAENNGNQVVVTVRDSGVGIRKENIGKLFRIDTHFTSNGTSNEKGSGLGLLLCKEFVEKHGGNIWVESETGKGSEFKFSLPVNLEVQN